jgi:hypothetical protein
VRIQILVTERLVDLIAERVYLEFRLGALKDSCLTAQRILTNRRQLVASPQRRLGKFRGVRRHDIHATHRPVSQ